MNIDAIIFDLDDTLFDTWGQLVRPATLEFCAAMIKAGLQTDLHSAYAQYQAIFRDYSSQDPFLELAEFFGTSGKSTEELADIGRKAYFQRDVEPWIKPFKATIPLLTELTSKYSLFLVTSGSPNTQQQKIDYLNVASFFQDIVIVDSTNGQKKTQAFKYLLNTWNIHSTRCLSVGDRVDREISEGKALGMQTCWIQSGEFEHVTPSGPHEEPDVTITCLSQLTEAINL